MDEAYGRRVQVKIPKLQLCCCPYRPHQGLQRNPGCRLGPLPPGIERVRRNRRVRSLPLQLCIKLTYVPPSPTSFEIYWFKQGTFHRQGDGGFLNVSLYFTFRF